MRTPPVRDLLSNNLVDEIALLDIREIRRRNLETLIEGAGGIKPLADMMRTGLQRSDPDAAYRDYANTISQYRTGKPMGTEFARDLEAGVGKPKNWMDVLQPDPAEKSVLGREAAQIIAALDPELQAAAMRMLRAFQATRPKGPNNPFGEAPTP